MSNQKEMHLPKIREYKIVQKKREMKTRKLDGWNTFSSWSSGFRRLCAARIDLGRRF